MRFLIPCIKVLSPRPRTSSHDDFEGVEIIARRMHVLLPTSSFRALWDWGGLVLVLYSIIHVPLEICFVYKMPDALWAFNICVDIFFILDIVMNFRTAFFEEKMLSPVLDPRMIARNYIFGRRGWGGWFWFDIIAAIPFDWVRLDPAKGGSILSFFKLCRIFRLSRLVRKLDHFTAAHVVRVSNFLMLLLLSTHCMACVWWRVGWNTSGNRGWQFDDYVANVLLEADISESNDGTLFAASNAAGDIVYNGTRLREIIDSVPLPKKYITSLYWALTMVMKSPWLSPSHVGEQIYASITVILGAMLFAAFIGNFTTAIASYDKSNAIYRDTIGLLRGFFKTRPALKLRTRKRVFRYADAYFKQTIEGVTEQSVIRSMPEHIRPAILLELHADLIESCSWLQETSFACCADFLLTLKPEIVLRGDILMQAGVITNSFYMLTSGELQVTFPPEGTRVSKLSALLGEGRASITKSSSMQRTSSRVPQGRIERMGSLVGWSAPHAKSRPNAYTVRASRDSSLLSISRQELADVLNKHPLDAPIFKKAADHANKLINPIKRSMSNNGQLSNNSQPSEASRMSSSSERSNGKPGEAGVVLTDRRCSTTEVAGIIQKGRNGSVDALVKRKGSQPSRDNYGRDTGSESAEDDQSLREATESGWLQAGSSATSDTFTEPMSTKCLNAGPCTKQMCVEEALTTVLEEVLSLKTKVACLQTTIDKSTEETMAVRKLVTRPAGHALSW